jgi:hypothetical protein
MFVEDSINTLKTTKLSDQGGELGNNMFQYASMYAIAKSKGMRFVVPADLDLLKIFKLNVSDIYHSEYLIFELSYLCSSLV